MRLSDNAWRQAKAFVGTWAVLAVAVVAVPKPHGPPIRVLLWLGLLAALWLWVGERHARPRRWPVRLVWLAATGVALWAGGREGRLWDRLLHHRDTHAWDVVSILATLLLLGAAADWLHRRLASTVWAEAPARQAQSARRARSAPRLLLWLCGTCAALAIGLLGASELVAGPLEVFDGYVEVFPVAGNLPGLLALCLVLGVGLWVEQMAERLSGRRWPWVQATVLIVLLPAAVSAWALVSHHSWSQVHGRLAPTVAANALTLATAIGLQLLLLQNAVGDCPRRAEPCR